MNYFNKLTDKQIFIIAEIGINHNGNIELAKQLIVEAKNAGANAVKFQVYNTSLLCSTIHKKEQIDILNKFNLGNNEHRILKEFSEEIGILWLATPFDQESLKFLVNINTEVIKIGSGELTHTPLLNEVAQYNIPTIISTGSSTLDDIHRATDIFIKANTEFSILHCVAKYPAPIEILNLNAIKTLQNEFKTTIIGFSDHSLGSLGATIACSLGAKIIEKHITLDNSMEGPDHLSSLNHNDFKKFIKDIRITENALGNGIKKRENGENVTGRSIVANIDLIKGDIIRKGSLAYKRPGTHLRPYMRDVLIGQKLNKAIKKDDFITLEDID